MEHGKILRERTLELIKVVNHVQNHEHVRKRIMVIHVRRIVRVSGLEHTDVMVLVLIQ